MPTEKTILFADAQLIREFVEFCERRDAPTEPCRCHADADLFANGNGAPKTLDEAMEEVIADQWADEAAELADMIADAVKPGDANYTLLLKLTRRLQTHIRRA